MCARETQADFTSSTVSVRARRSSSAPSRAHLGSWASLTLRLRGARTGAERRKTTPCFDAPEIVVTEDRSPTYEYLGPEVTHVITYRNEATCNLKAFAFPLSMHHQGDCCSARAPFGAGTACACYTPLSCKWASHGAATLPVDLPARPWARSQGSAAPTLCWATCYARCARVLVIHDSLSSSDATVNTAPLTLARSRCAAKL